MNGPLLPNGFGVRLPLGTLAASKPHASRGGNHYPAEMRQQVIAMFNAGGKPALDAAYLLPLRHQNKFPHINTCMRWVSQYQLRNNCLPKRPSGNHHAMREITGIDLLNLAIYRAIRPKAYIDEVRAFVHNMNPAVMPYSQSQICRAENRLEIVRKVASTTSDCAHLPINELKRQNYWEKEYPEGVHRESICDMIDIDECNLKLESSNRNRGKVVRELRCDAAGKFKKGSASVSLLMAIGGEDQTPFSFHKTFTEGGTDLWRYYCFIEDLIKFLDEHFPGRSFCFTKDNLNIHKNPMIINMIYAAGHRLIFRAPYWSCDGAIEYVFNTIHTKLQMQFNAIDDCDELLHAIDSIIGTLDSFVGYFEHVGFQM